MGGHQGWDGLRPVDVVELLDAAQTRSQVAWRDQSAGSAMALVVSTLAAHGRMNRFLASSARRVDPNAVAHVRAVLEPLVLQIRANTALPAVVVGHCYQYLAAAREQLHRITEALVASAWAPSPDMPGRWAQRGLTPV